MARKTTKADRLAELALYFTEMRDNGSIGSTFISHESLALAEGVARLAEICSEQEKEIAALKDQVAELRIVLVRYAPCK